MTNFDKTWARQDKPGMSDKLRESVKPQGALKPRIQTGVNKLQVQISKLDSMLHKLRERDARLFQRIVIAMKEHDTQTSKILSTNWPRSAKSPRCWATPGCLWNRYSCALPPSMT